MITPLSIRTWAAVMLAAGLTVIGASSAGAHATKRPPCTRSALNAGVHRGAEPLPLTSQVFRPYGCAGRFAYGNFDVDGNDVTVLFIARSDKWVTASRGKYCPGHVVPRRIWQPACNVN
jgi:hypothetical protein